MAFVEWRSLGILTFVGAVWALLAGTRLLRGEEEAGRWEILLSGQTTRRRATASALAGLGISLAGLFTITGVLTVAAGRYPGADFPLGGSLYLALTLTGSAWVCMAVAALTSQLAPTRRAAATWASGAFGLMFLTRAIADSAISLHWLRLLAPARLDRGASSTDRRQLVMLIPLVSFIFLLSGAAIYLLKQA